MIYIHVGYHRRTSASASAQNGVSSEGLTTAVHPAANAAAAFLVIIAMGKFQGVMRAATPTGCLVMSILLFLAIGGRMSP